MAKKDKKLPEKVMLKKVTAHSLYLSTSERSGKITGYYKNPSIAEIDGKDAGWYGGDGEVSVVDYVYQDESGNLFELTPLGKFVDVEKKYEDDTKNKIMEKLSPHEIDFLGLKK